MHRCQWGNGNLLHTSRTEAKVRISLADAFLKLLSVLILRRLCGSSLNSSELLNIGEEFKRLVRENGSSYSSSPELEIVTV